MLQVEKGKYKGISLKGTIQYGNLSIYIYAFSDDEIDIELKKDSYNDYVLCSTHYDLPRWRKLYYEKNGNISFRLKRLKCYLSDAMRI